VENHDEQFEKYLGEFQPQRPRALPEPDIHRQFSLRRLAAAAVVTIALGAAFWSVRQKPANQEARYVTNNRPVALKKQTPRRALSLVELTRIALENPEGLDAALEAAQENRLPRFDRKDSALRILAKE
jgi:hypothetical protein